MEGGWVARGRGSDAGANDRARAGDSAMMDFFGERPGMEWCWGSIMMIVFIAATIVVATVRVRWLSGALPTLPPPRALEKAPLDLLKERFAR
jgi:hypothetical protein